MTAVRTLVASCPDWSITAGGFSSSELVAVIADNRLISCSEGARNLGVEPGQRRRSAQSVCPALQILIHDRSRDAKAFEPVISSVEGFCPKVQVIEPGICALATRGPSRYFGGDEQLVAVIRDAVTAVVAPKGGSCGVGIADGPFAARIAAERSMVVPPGQSAQFLAPFPVAALGRPELTSLLMRLGIRTLGAFGDLDNQAVVARFGPDGLLAHRLASGLDASAIVPHPPAIDLTAEVTLEPPAERVDVAAFATRSIASELFEKLHTYGLTPRIVAVEAYSDHGESLTRHWRFDESCTETDLGERMRWQLDGWLSGSSGQPPTAGVNLVRLVASEVIPATGRQIGLWGESTDADLRAVRGLARVQALLGPDSVFTARIIEGRDPRERAPLVAWGEAPPSIPTTAPWPASVPSPAPTIVFTSPECIDVFDSAGNVVTVSRRGVLSEEPSELVIGGKRISVIATAGPWTNDDRWWDRTMRKRRAFLQVLTQTGAAHLVTREHNQWWLEATYD